MFRRTLAVVLVIAAFPAAASWVSIGPSGGTIWDVATSAAAPGVVWIATDGLLFRSADGGGTWTPVVNGPQGVEVTAIEIHPTNASIVYVATRGKFVWKTTDGGTSWARLLGSREQVLSLAIDPNAPDTIYAGDIRYGVYRSVNGGASWTRRATGLDDHARPNQIVVDPRTSALYVAMYAPAGMLVDDGIYRSADGGGSWTRISGGFLADTYGASRPWDIAIDDSTNPSTIWAATENELAKAVDAGAAPTWPWSRMLSAPTFGVAVHPTDGGIVVAGGENTIHRTANGGASWTTISSGIEGKYFSAFGFDASSPARVFAGNNRTLFRSADSGASWAEASSGLEGVTIEDIAWDGTRAMLVSGTRDVVYRRPSGGAWTRAALPSGYSTIGLSVGGSSMFASLWVSGCRWYGGGAYLARSADAGSTWTSPLRLYPEERPLLAIAAAPSNASVVWVNTESFGKAVLKSTDGGVTFARPDDLSCTFIPRPNCANLSFAGKAILIHPTDPNTVYLANGERVLKTTDGGETFTLLAAGPRLDIEGMDMNPANPQHLVVADYDAIWNTTDGGASWQSHNPEPLGADLRATAVLFDPARPGTIYVSSREWGIFRSTDGGATWSPFSDGLGSKSVTSLAAGPGGKVYAGTRGNSAWQLAMPSTPADVDGDGAKQALSDGLLILRYIFGFRGNTLIQGAYATAGDRTTATSIEAHLAANLASYDIDGNGAFEALADGLLILRYLFGFRGDTLIAGAIGAGATRTTAAQVEAYIAGL